MVSRNTVNDGGNDPSSPNAAPAGSVATLHTIWHRRWWVLLSVVVAMITAWVYLSKQTPIYSSTSRLYVQQFTKIVGVNGVNNSLENSTAASTQAELISSGPLLEQVASLPAVQDLQIIKNVSNPVPFIKSGLTVTTDRDFINIAFESPNRIEAAQLVNAIADAYISFIGKQHQNTAAEVLKLLQKEKDKREIELASRRKATLDYKRAHGILSFQDEKGNIVVQRLSRLSELLTSAQLETMDAQAKLEIVTGLAKDPGKLLDLARSESAKEMEVNVDRSETSHDQVDARLLASSDAVRADIDQTERRLDRLRRTRTPAHKDVKDAELDLAMLKDQLAHTESQILERKQKLLDQEQELARSKKMQTSSEVAQYQVERDRRLVDAYVMRTTQRATMAKQREAQLQKNFDDQKKDAFDLNSTAAEYAALDSELARTERLVNMLQDRIKDINVSEDTNMVAVNIIDTAKPGDVPVRPDRKRVLGIGLLLGLLLGGGIAFGIDRFDQRVRSADEISALVGAPVLGLVPNISLEESPSMRGRKVLLEPTSEISEAYRTIRTAVYFAAREEKTKKLLITSPAPGDGKTTSASNLAIAIAQAGRRVLLLDADFRRPTQHKIFQVSPDIGLCSVMSGVASLESAIHRTEVENLHLLPCGPLPKNPSEILNGQAFADLLEGLERKYDHIIIDSPPVAPVTDARILGALCDETILVIRADKSTRRVTEHARNSLLSVGANILGVIINDVPQRRERYGAYYGYGGYYRYGYGYGYGYRSYKYKYYTEDQSGKEKGKDKDKKASEASVEA